MASAALNKTMIRGTAKSTAELARLVLVLIWTGWLSIVAAGEKVVNNVGAVESLVLEMISVASVLEAQ